MMTGIKMIDLSFLTFEQITLIWQNYMDCYRLCYNNNDLDLTLDQLHKLYNKIKEIINKNDTAIFYDLLDLADKSETLKQFNDKIQRSIDQYEESQLEGLALLD